MGYKHQVPLWLRKSVRQRERDSGRGKKRSGVMLVCRALSIRPYFCFVPCTDLEWNSSVTNIVLYIKPKPSWTQGLGLVPGSGPILAGAGPFPLEPKLHAFHPSLPTGRSWCLPEHTHRLLPQYIIAWAMFVAEPEGLVARS